MNRKSTTIILLAYIIGLLISAGINFAPNFGSWLTIGGVGFGFMVLGIVMTALVPKVWKTGPKKGIWIVAGLVAAIAVIYLQLRIPQPAGNDVSKLVPQKEQLVTVQGRVLTSPRTTRSQRSQFLLAAQRVNEVEGKEGEKAVNRGVGGKLYVTVPLLQGTGIHPQQILYITGSLYTPQPPLNPGAFDFQAYLARQGIFAGLNGKQVIFPEVSKEKDWGLWRLRQRINQVQVASLGSPEGLLLSSIVLGRRAVDLPKDISDLFIKAGLAHVLAASGFHVSLILGVVLGLTRGLKVESQFIIALTTLFIYVGLTGCQPSVMRALIMGVGALIALLTQRKVRQLGSLLLAAIFLLLWQPTWIADVGFQLSFLATLGLIVTLPPLIKKLDWLPLTIASIISVPLAIFPWVLPLQLYYFNVVATYSIAVNIITAPIVALVSLGGMVSALIASFVPTAGTSAASLLYYPLHFLIAIVEFFTNLPGSTRAVGSISLASVLLLYGAIIFVFYNKWLQRRWWLAASFAALIIAIPIVQKQAGLFQVTVLAANEEQVLVIQDQGKVTLINSGNDSTALFTVLPFLQQEGINKIDWAVALEFQPDLTSGWQEIFTQIPVENFFYTETANQILSSNASQPLTIKQPTAIGSVVMQLISADPPALQLNIRNQTWLLLGQSKLNSQIGEIEQHLQQLTPESAPQVIIWTGGSLKKTWLSFLKPKVGIASASTLEREITEELAKKQTQLYWTSRNGAVQWIPEDGFQSNLDVIDADASGL
ncbi:MAG: ComEC/Rec2 family competence protein [Spirulinaceae cyanobacterium]